MGIVVHEHLEGHSLKTPAVEKHHVSHTHLSNASWDTTLGKSQPPPPAPNFTAVAPMLRTAACLSQSERSFRATCKTESVQEGLLVKVAELQSRRSALQRNKLFLKR
uniref:Uncharacterized protein n=1 Tax=Sphaerodactylus townsendi TaxID=933632 RepID=A0ACB8EY99_9SAUR